MLICLQILIKCEKIQYLPLVTIEFFTILTCRKFFLASNKDLSCNPSQSPFLYLEDGVHQGEQCIFFLLKSVPGVFTVIHLSLTHIFNLWETVQENILQNWLLSWIWNSSDLSEGSCSIRLVYNKIPKIENVLLLKQACFSMRFFYCLQMSNLKDHFSWPRQSSIVLSPDHFWVLPSILQGFDTVDALWN